MRDGLRQHWDFLQTLQRNTASIDQFQILTDQVARLIAAFDQLSGQNAGIDQLAALRLEVANKVGNTELQELRDSFNEAVEARIDEKVGVEQLETLRVETIGTVNVLEGRVRDVLALAQKTEQSDFEARIAAVEAVIDEKVSSVEQHEAVRVETNGSVNVLEWRVRNVWALACQAGQSEFLTCFRNILRSDLLEDIKLHEVMHDMLSCLYRSRHLHETHLYNIMLSEVLHCTRSRHRLVHCLDHILDFSVQFTSPMRRAAGHARFRTFLTGRYARFRSMVIGLREQVHV